MHCGHYALRHSLHKLYSLTWFPYPFGINQQAFRKSTGFRKCF